MVSTIHLGHLRFETTASEDEAEETFMSLSTSQLGEGGKVEGRKGFPVRLDYRTSRKCITAALLPPVRTKAADSNLGKAVGSERALCHLLSLQLCNLSHDTLCRQNGKQCLLLPAPLNNALCTCGCMVGRAASL